MILLAQHTATLALLPIDLVPYTGTVAAGLLLLPMGIPISVVVLGGVMYGIVIGIVGIYCVVVGLLIIF